MEELRRLRILAGAAIAAMHRWPVPHRARTLAGAAVAAIRQWNIRDRARNLAGAAVAAVRRWPVRDYGRTLVGYGRQHAHLIGFVICVVLVLALGWLETRTSVLESQLLSSTASRLRYEIEPAPSTNIEFPRSGPLDAERGYSRIPEFVKRLETRGFEIHEQSKFSPGLAFLGRMGVPLPYRAAPVAGLVLRDARGDTLFNGNHGHYLFHSYDAIPPVVVRSLLFIENRQLGGDGPRTQNPAVDWGRLMKAASLWVGRHMGLPLRVEGGSTLAVQLVKYHHSSEGRTQSPVDKLRQIAAASLAAYRSGPNTQQERREVVLDYMNTVPLAATPDRGEIAGLGDGLRAWFALEPDRVWHAIDHAPLRARAAAYKPVLALLCAAQAPTRDLLEDRDGLERRVDAYTRLFERAGVIDAELAQATLAAPLEFATPRNVDTPPLPAERKPAYAIRRSMSEILGVPNFYDLNRLDLQVQTTLDDSLQAQTLQLFRSLADTAFVNQHGLRGEHLLTTGDPRRVVYSLVLYESAPGSDRACAYVDNLDGPFDLNSGMKLELGSTAKLRTLAHYLQIVERLNQDLAGFHGRTLEDLARAAGDPITRWVEQTMAEEPGITLDTLLSRSLDRRYSANPGETFFTGGGLHEFHNFDPEDNSKVLSIREALVHSTNLVFIRLMRDVVRYHEAHLPYDVDAVFADTGNSDRKRLLSVAAEDESRLILWRAYQQDRKLDASAIEAELMGRDSVSVKRSAALFYAWNPGATPDSLATWLKERFPDLEPEQIESLARTYGNSSFTLLDYGYLLDHHPLEVWCAGELFRSPGESWSTIQSRSADARRLCSAWLFDPRHVRAQELRLRTQIEREAFDLVTPEWRRLGFPFERLVPSYATAIGASGDRPVALAELMGVVLNDGVRRPRFDIERLVFGPNTPYHTALEAKPQGADRLLSIPVARTLRRVLAEVVERGTAHRISGVFTAPDSTPLEIGGKTGSGDNRFDSFDSGHRLIGSKSTSRTATFAFFIGDRHYGVITASVWGSRAGDYCFTSALPLSVLRLLAPALEAHLRQPAPDANPPAPAAGPVTMNPAPSSP